LRVGHHYIFFVLYSILLHLPPLRFHCADGCWDRTQTLQLMHWQSDALTSRLDLIRNTPQYYPVISMRTTTISPLTSMFYISSKETNCRVPYKIWERPVPDVSYGYGVHPTLYVNHGLTNGLRCSRWLGPTKNFPPVTPKKTAKTSTE
jgi:hypothetical protein